MSNNAWIQRFTARLADGTSKVIILTAEDCQALHAALVRGDEALRKQEGNVHGHGAAFLWGGHGHD